MTPADLKEIGTILYDRAYPKPMGKDLGRAAATVWKWGKGQLPITESVAKSVINLAVAKIEARRKLEDAWLAKHNTAHAATTGERGE